MNETDPKSVIKANVSNIYEILQKAEFRANNSVSEISDMYDLCKEIEDSCKDLEMYENYLVLNLVHQHLRALVKRDPSLKNFVIEINLKEPGQCPAYLKLDLYPR